VESDVPISITLTEFHFVVVYKDRVVAVSSLDEKLAYEETIPLVSPFCTVMRPINGIFRALEKQ
jgi:hypothetical protein